MEEYIKTDKERVKKVLTDEDSIVGINTPREESHKGNNSSVTKTNAKTKTEKEKYKRIKGEESLQRSICTFPSNPVN